MQFFSKSLVGPDGAMFFDATFVNDKGEITHRIVPLDDYVEMLKKSRVERKEEFVNIPILPKEVVRCKMSANDPSTFEAWVVYPAKVRPLTYMSQLYVVPYPAMAAKISVKKGVRQDMSLFALDKDTLKEGDTLYHYPFGNVGNGGSCCFGNIVAKASGPENASDILDMFITGNTNNDLYFNQNTEKLSQKDLLDRIKGLETYPLELLVASNKKYK